MFIYHYCVLHIETNPEAHVTLYEGQSSLLAPTTSFETPDGKKIYAWLIRKNNLSYFLNLSSGTRQKCDSYPVDVKMSNLKDLETVYECSKEQRLPLSILNKIKK